MRRARSGLTNPRPKPGDWITIQWKANVEIIRAREQSVSFMYRGKVRTASLASLYQYGKNTTCWFLEPEDVR